MERPLNIKRNLDLVPGDRLTGRIVMKGYAELPARYDVVGFEAAKTGLMVNTEDEAGRPMSFPLAELAEGRCGIVHIDRVDQRRQRQVSELMDNGSAIR
jgi:hypothetical protein